MTDVQPPQPDARRHQAVANAWQIHSALADWTKSLDAKASFTLATESAVLGVIAALRASGSALTHPTGRLSSAVLATGVALLAASVLCAALSVLPRGSASPRGAAQPPGTHDLIFYGHLRTWSPQHLARRLCETDLLDGLSRQLVTMSRIAWAKHRYIRTSLVLALPGTALVGLAAVLS